jgi:acetyltransferase-like isoleucine patch superfamily enzyme
MTIEVTAGRNNELSIGEGTRFLDGVRLMLRGGRTRTGARCRIRDNVVMKADGELTVGDDVLISQGSTLHCSTKIAIEDRVSLAERVSVTDSDHDVDGSDVHHMSQPLRTEEVNVGSNTLVSAGSVILRGTRIGRNSVVAANSVVRGGEYSPRSMLAGNPARVVKALGDHSRSQRLDAVAGEFQRTAP